MLENFIFPRSVFRGIFFGEAFAQIQYNIFIILNNENWKNWKMLLEVQDFRCICNASSNASKPTDAIFFKCAKSSEALKTTQLLPDTYHRRLLTRG